MCGTTYYKTEVKILSHVPYNDNDRIYVIQVFEFRSFMRAQIYQSIFFIFICMLLELEICNWKEKNELVIGGSVWYHESPIYSSDTKGPCPPFLSFFHWLRNEWHSHLTTHKATKNEVDHVKLCTRKWHKILHVKKWIMFGGHPEFVVRQPK